MPCKSIKVLALAAFLAAPLSGPAFAIDDTSAVGSVDLTAARAKIKAHNYQAAITELRGLAQDNQDADVYNLLGFSLRKAGDYATALFYYERALALRPDHKAAREYLGELFLDTGEIGKAKEQLAVLATLCPIGCEERSDLQAAVAAKSEK